MSDFAYIGLGVVVLLVFAAYAAALRRL